MNRSMCVWVCKACGGTRGNRPTTGTPGRLLDVSEEVLVIAVPLDRSLTAYDGACTCRDTVEGAES